MRKPDGGLFRGQRPSVGSIGLEDAYRLTVYRFSDGCPATPAWFFDDFSGINSAQSEIRSSKSEANPKPK
jgi:hypothetical protein